MRNILPYLFMEVFLFFFKPGYRSSKIIPKKSIIPVTYTTLEYKKISNYDSIQNAKYDLNYMSYSFA